MILSRLKRLVLVPAVMSGLTACQSGADEPDGSGHGKEMVFTTEVLSRAAVTTSDNIISKPFAVYGDLNHGSLIVMFDGMHVTYSGNQWVYANTQYWFPGFQYSFVALHPADTQWVSDILYANSNLKFTYSQPANYKDASDLLVSAHRRDYAGGDTDAVCFSFSHILTNVNVLVSYNAPSTGTTSITIDDLTFRNIPLKSTYAIEPAPLAAGSSMTSDWVNDEGSLKGWTVNSEGSLEITFAADEPRVVQANKGSFPLFSSDDPLLLLPNPYNPSLPAELEFNYTTNTGKTETVSAIIPKGWNPGTSLTLSLEIGEGMVQFSVTVDDWKDGTTTNTTVPRK